MLRCSLVCEKIIIFINMSIGKVYHPTLQTLGTIVFLGECIIGLRLKCKELISNAGLNTILRVCSIDLDHCSDAVRLLLVTQITLRQKTVKARSIFIPRFLFLVATSMLRRQKSANPQCQEVPSTCRCVCHLYLP